MNKIDLSQLPHKNNKINWKECNNNPVKFTYRDIEDTLYVVSNIDMNYITVSYRNNDYILSKECLKHCNLGKLFNFAVNNNYKYNVGDVLSQKVSDIIIKEQKRIYYKNHSFLGYNISCLKCYNDTDITEANLQRGQGCSFCSGKKPIIGETDLWTTHPNICAYLYDKSDGYKYSAYSNQKIRFICPFCHEDLGFKKISDVTLHGISCYKCGDGISYPNKFLYNLLSQLDINYIPEAGYQWCIFPSFSNPNQLSHGRFDCIIEDLKLIIEMDGGLGHGNRKHSKSTVSIDEQLYRDQQKELIANQYGYDVIRIDCNYIGHENRFECCKNAILNSNLSNIFDLSNIDWTKVDIDSQKSILFEICDLYNLGLSSGEIASKLCLDQSTVIDYLHKGNDLNLCIFKPYKQKIKKGEQQCSNLEINFVVSVLRKESTKLRI